MKSPRPQVSWVLLTKDALNDEEVEAVPCPSSLLLLLLLLLLRSVEGIFQVIYRFRMIKRRKEKTRRIVNVPPPLFKRKNWPSTVPFPLLRSKSSLGNLQTSLSVSTRELEMGNCSANCPTLLSPLHCRGGGRGGVISFKCVIKYATNIFSSSRQKKNLN